MNKYAKMLEAAENVIAEGGDGWWGAEQLGEETNSWVPQVDCEFIEVCSPVEIIGLLKDLENFRSLNEAVEVLTHMQQNRIQRLQDRVHRLESDLNFERQLNNRSEERY